MANINKNEIGYNENTTANALMVQYKRGLAAPMDISEVFTSLISAEQYAANDPISYAGQTIAVAGEGIKTEVYKITSGGTLVRLIDEGALGEYNIYTPKTSGNTTADATHFSIGIGTSESDRKNAVEVKQNGDVYITGIGGFDGVNYDNSKSVQDTINELTETVKNLNDIIKQITLTEEKI